MEVDTKLALADSLDVACRNRCRETSDVRMDSSYQSHSVNLEPYSSAAVEARLVYDDVPSAAHVDLRRSSPTDQTHSWAKKDCSAGLEV